MNERNAVIDKALTFAEQARLKAIRLSNQGNTPAAEALRRKADSMAARAHRLIFTKPN